MDEYFAFNERLLSELLRVSGTVFYNIQMVTGNRSALFRLMGRFHNNIKELIIWDKMNAEPAMKHSTLNSRYEMVLVLTGDKSNAMTRLFKNAKWGRGTLQNLWQIKRGKKPAGSHGAVFPEELIGKILLNFTDTGDLVIDPLMGTGTTGWYVRRWVGGLLVLSRTPHILN